MIAFLQVASARSAGILSVIAESLGFAGQVPVPARRADPCAGTTGPGAKLRQPSGDWYERLP